MDLRIKDLTIKDKTTKIHENIPELPFNCCMYGKSACGKTNVLLNLMGFYKKQFKNRLIIFTLSRNGSLYSLEKSMGAKIFNSIYDEEGIDRIQSVLDFQKKRKENNEPLKNICIIFDDYISDSIFSKRRSILDKLYAMARHFRISVITTSQQYTLLPSTIRRLSWYDCVFKISNNAEKKLMISEECNAIDSNEEEFESIYNDCVKEPYSFMFIDKLKGRWLKKFGQ
jgi:regulator of sigma D